MPDISAYFVKGNAGNFSDLVTLAEQEGAIRAIDRERFTLIVANIDEDVLSRFKALGGAVFEDFSFQPVQIAVDYRGIDKNEVIATLQVAESFLRCLGLGPETTKVLDEWLGGDPYGKIAAAQDRVALAQVMSETGSASLLLRLNSVFHFHALADTDGTARKLYEDLCGWGAFSGMMTMEYRRTDEEQDSHLVAQYLKAVVGKDAQETAERLGEILKGFAERNGADRYEGLHETMLDMISLAYEGNEAGIRQAFLAGDLHFRHVMKAAFLHASGMAEREGELNIPAVFDRFGIVTDSLPRDYKKMQDDPLFKEMCEALKPFWATYEVQSTGFGIITFDEPRKIGIVFTATRPAALAVADRLPQAEVIDSRGERVTPGSEAKPAIRRRKPGFGSADG